MNRKIKPHGMPVTNNTNSNRFLLLGILLLIILSYGRIMTRGGYADDFSFLAYSTSNTYLDAALGWISTFNSRISQGIMMPVLLKGLSTNSITGFHWGLLHAIGLSAFLATMVFIYRIFSLFNIPGHVSFVALSIFALNPVKNEALLWPATIVGYILPLCLFSAASWLYFSSAKHDTATAAKIAGYSLLFVFSILSIEQLLPLFLVVVAIRMIFLALNRKQFVANLTGTFLVIAIFALVTFAGKTTERIDRFTALDLASIPAHIMNILAGSVIEILGYTPRILLDPYYHPDLFSAAFSAGYILSIAAIIIISVWFYRSMDTVPGKSPHNKRMPMYLVAAGTCIWISSLTPFMVLSYYVPARSLYIPSLGVALVAAALFGYIYAKLQNGIPRAVLSSAFSVLLAAYVLINLYSEQDFAHQWENEKLIIDFVDSKKDRIPVGTELAIFNVPHSEGPTPGFVNRYTFNGMLNWIAPERKLQGHTLKDFSDIYRIPESISQYTRYSVPPLDNYWALLWTPESVLRLGNIKLVREQNDLQAHEPGMDTGDFEYSGSQAVDLTGLVRPINQAGQYNNDMSIHVNTMIIMPQIDSGLVQVSVDGTDITEDKYRLVLHALHQDGSSKPYDLTLSREKGFRESATGLSKYVFINDFFSVSSLQFSLTTISGKRLKRGSPDTGEAGHTNLEPGISRSTPTPDVIFF
jgi:hypothetical protein